MEATVAMFDARAEELAALLAEITEGDVSQWERALESLLNAGVVERDLARLAPEVAR